MASLATFSAYSVKYSTLVAYKILELKVGV